MKSKISGILIFISVVLTLYSYFFSDFLLLAALFLWLALILLFDGLKNKKLLMTLFVLGLFILFACMYLGYEIDIKKLLSINQNMIVLLISVGFLRLIATPKFEKISHLPKGKKAFFQTYLGIHFFGAVINISAMIIIADKLYKNAKLTATQIITLSRAFSTDAFWSMFFVAFAAAITYAPKLDFLIVSISGLSLAFLAFLYTCKELFYKFDMDEFTGYPLSFSTLYIPLLLSFIVLLTHYFYKSVQIITLISLFSLILSILILIPKDGFKSAIINFYNHISKELPNMKGEISLFLFAGFFGMSVSFLLLGSNFNLPFATYDYKIASLFLALFLLLGFFGIHPIISIAVLSDLLQNANHTLLGATFLMAWSLNVTNSPLSGVNLTISSRYNINGMDIFKLNFNYTLMFYFICVIMLYILSKILGI